MSSVHDEMMEIFSNLNRYFADSLREILTENKKEIESLDCVNEDIETFRKTGILTPSFETIPSESPVPSGEPIHGKNSKRLVVLDENNESGGALKENLTSDPNTMGEATSSKSLEHHDSINNTKQIIIRTEEKSVLDIRNNNESNNNNVKTKKEISPPAQLPAKNVRQKKQKRASNIEKEKVDQIKKASIIRDSGVQIQKDAFLLVVSDECVEEPQPARCTRARTKNRIEKASEETEENFIKTPTSTPIVKEPQKLVNETLILNKSIILNRTVVIEKATAQNRIDMLEQPGTSKKNDNDSISDEDVVAASPVKKPVRTFEKLRAVGNFDASSKTIKRSKPGEKEITRNIAASTQEGAIPKIFPTQKMSTPQMQFLERELRQNKKVTNPLQKKQTMINAQIEEKRKKREKRELKVQQVKMALERDKQKKLELAERAKDEKDANLQKQMEELSKKLIAAAKKTAGAKLEKKKEIHTFLKYETPLLPTKDCYDSDNSLFEQQVKQKWEKGKYTYLLFDSQINRFFFVF
ncbi:hypothetical protein FQA39_LY13173 [Lamprigera yunnana]|nr:hypothetical protein FQA39_LY13173 [Lamprigera yunnana]